MAPGLARIRPGRLRRRTKSCPCPLGDIRDACLDIATRYRQQAGTGMKSSRVSAPLSRSIHACLCSSAGPGAGVPNLTDRPSLLIFTAPSTRRLQGPRVTKHRLDPAPPTVSPQHPPPAATEGRGTVRDGRLSPVICRLAPAGSRASLPLAKRVAGAPPDPARPRVGRRGLDPPGPDADSSPSPGQAHPRMLRGRDGRAGDLPDGSTADAGTGLPSRVFPW